MKNRYSKAFKILSVILVLCLSLCVALPQNVTFAEEAEAITSAKAEIQQQTGYKQVAENKNLILYANMSNGYFAVLNKKNGSLWYSVPPNTADDKLTKGLAKSELRSHLVLDYLPVEDLYKGVGVQSANSYQECVQKGGIKIEKITNGIKIVFTFERLGFVIPVTYTIKDDYLEATIDTKNLDEGDTNLLVTVYFLNFMGAVGPEEDGYLFVPDGCGAVASFNKGIIPYSNYAKMVYGGDKAEIATQEITQQENISLPVFGTVVESKGAMFTIITSGDGAATIGAKTNNAKQYWNVANARMRYRVFKTGQGLYETAGYGDRIATVTDQPFGVDAFTLRYYFLDGEDASYTGMAKCYRDYLTKEKGLEKSVSKSTLALNVYGSLETEANFLGIKYNKKQVLTSFDDTKAIVEELKSEGVDNISLLYNGWTNNGVYNRKYLKSATPLSVLGGKKGMDSLIDYLSDNGFDYYLGADFLNFSQSSLGISRRKDSAAQPNGDVAYQYEHSIVTYGIDRETDPWVLISPLELKSASSKFLKDFNKKGYDSICLSNIGSTIYSDFSPKDGIYRSTGLTLLEDFIKSVDVENVAVDGANAYAVSYADKVYNLPVSSSKYDIFDYDVPFIQMVFHGYKSYTTPAVIQSVDPETLYLKSIETGSDLQFLCVSDDSYNLRETRLSYMYSSEFSLWKDMAVSYYKEQSKVNNLVYDQVIVGHECVAKDVFKTVYANGTTVYVNYNTEDVTIGDITVKAENYLVVKEAA